VIRIIRDLILTNRSYRIFDESIKIDCNTLKGFIKLARLTSSRGNRQPLKFVLSCHDEINNKIFSKLFWAKQLKNWEGHQEGEKPSAYIIALGDTTIGNEFSFDTGLACQSILMGAVEAGFGGCMINNINRDELRRELNIDEIYEIMIVLAIGKPKQKSIIEEIGNDGSLRYWFDDENNNHVPKRSVDELILNIY